jgi:crotonobetainyl-CoA:carnitine CoA-transferase CaiB-like acyl-CoA transferase
MSSTFQPLAGIRVLDLSRVLAGPLCSMVLADLGADVIKVERPGHGDDTRAWGPPFVEPPSPLAGMSAYFASVNRNKRSLSLDLSKPEGREILKKLTERSDVVLENFLPSTAVKLGLAPQNLQAWNPRLIVCSITGFGHTGAWREQPGYDFVVQALSGLMAITGEPAGEPMKVGVALSDVLTGLYAALSVVAALKGATAAARPPAPDSTPAKNTEAGARQGVHIDLALLDCTVASLVNVAQAYLVTGARPERYGNAHAQIVPYECFPTADGHIVLAVGNDEQFRRFCSAAARDDLGRAERFATNPQRVTLRRELIPQLQQVFKTATTAEWQRRLEAAGVPHAPVQSIAEIMAEPQLQAREMVVHGSGLDLVGSPIKVTGAPPQTPTPPPKLGEHSDAILRELGYSADSIDRLRGARVI